jgi:hypothetical protein
MEVKGDECEELEQEVKGSRRNQVLIKNGTRTGSELEILTRSPESEELARCDSRTVCKVKYIDVLNLGVDVTRIATNE